MTDLNVGSKYPKAIRPDNLPAHIGKELVWLRDAPWGYGEVYIDDVTLVRITPTGRAVVEATNRDGKRVRRTVCAGLLLCPLGSGKNLRCECGERN
jgi:hypothetical protein